MPRSGLVVQALVPSIIEQKVTGKEAFAGYRRLVRRFGEPAPGPGEDLGLVVPPDPRGWAAIPSWEWLAAGVDPGRSRTVVRAVGHAGRLEECADLPADRRPGPAAPRCPASGAGPGPRWPSGRSACPTR